MNVMFTPHPACMIRVFIPSGGGRPALFFSLIPYHPQVLGEEAVQ